MAIVPAEPNDEDPEELKRFRAQWWEEVLQRRRQSQLQPEPHTDAGSSSTSPPLYALAAPHPLLINGAPPPPRQTALDIYRHAVLCEQAHRTDEALRLYQQAFRMDPDVDRAYHRAETSTHPPAHKSTTPGDAAVDPLTQAPGPPKPPSAGAVSTAGLLARVLAGFPEMPTFEAADARAPCALRAVPDELLVLVMRLLEPSAVERFGAASRKARVLTLDASIWRYAACVPVRCDCSPLSGCIFFRRRLVEATLRPPQIMEGETLEDILARYATDYRRVYIEHPRVRMDGVYIAICQYVYVCQIRVASAAPLIVPPHQPPRAERECLGPRESPLACRSAFPY